MKPIIGVTCSFANEGKRYVMNATYVNAVLASGGLPVVVPYMTDENDAKEYLSRLDGILFSGGPDIHPREYGEEVLPECGEIVEGRDVADRLLINSGLLEKMPFLGICRGIQSLCAFSGGTLWQDIPSQVGKEVLHSGTRHFVNAAEGTLYREVMGDARFEVNSYHHQALKKLPDGMIAAAKADDGIVEAICFEGRTDAMAVQYHPEMIFDDEHSKKLFSWFVNECRK